MERNAFSSNANASLAVKRVGVCGDEFERHRSHLSFSRFNLVAIRFLKSDGEMMVKSDLDSLVRKCRIEKRIFDYEQKKNVILNFELDGLAEEPSFENSIDRKCIKHLYMINELNSNLN